MKNERLHTSETQELRDEGTVNNLINSAIIEVIDSFGEEMTERDKDLLLGVTREVSTNPVGRVWYLRKIGEMREEMGASDNIVGYINQALQTIQQSCTKVERDQFTWGMSNLLDEIT